VLLAASLAAAESATRVSGVAQDAAGGVIPGARVELWVEGGDPITQFTRTDGRFVFYHISPGPYRLTFHSPGFKQHSIRVEPAAGNHRDLGAVILPIVTLGCPTVEITSEFECTDDASFLHRIAAKRLRKRAVRMPMPSMPAPPADGRVRVKVGIWGSGTIACSAALSGDPRLAREALAAVGQWQFLSGDPLLGYVDFVFSRRSRTPVSLK
jgi:hypothetical protein